MSRYVYGRLFARPIASLLVGAMIPAPSRATEREINSPEYPGHTYYGFRPAISAAGWKILQQRQGEQL